MLTREASGLAGLFISVFLLSLLLGNVIIIAMSLVPLFTLLLGMLLEPPKAVEVRPRGVKRPIWVGEVVEVAALVTIRDGIGLVTLAQELPPELELVEGSNLRVVWKGRGPVSFEFSYKVRCPKRGSYTLSPFRWESRHALSLLQTVSGSQGPAPELLVRPRILNIRRIRGIPSIAASPFPVIDIAKIGVATTDFREIRSYVHGDPIKSINWKATARMARKGQSWPLVNEYEVEGKKAVWIFLDGSSSMEVGTNITNAFECALEAAHGVAYFFLERGYRVGMYIYNDGRKFFYPDAGRKQSHRITRGLTVLKAAREGDHLPEAVERCKGYLLGSNPLCVIVTRLDSPDAGSLLEGTKKLSALRGRSRKKLPLVVISVAGYTTIPTRGEYEAHAAVLLRVQTRPLVSLLRRMRASVLEWDPKRESFGVALMRQVRTR